jgi:asparagine synthase (glutamine-hydrolysing)
MCGINGVLHKNNQPINENLLVQMRDSLIHRGPDDAGIWIDNNVGFGHRRLSILDTSKNGHQPRLSNDGRYAIVFNGEIYNYKEFKSELHAKGYSFTSESDTEVLLYLYIEYGEAMLDRLNGMFSFSIWDSQEQELFIARDRVGVKPLYFFNSDSLFAFASEPKALFAYGVDKSIDESQLNEWLFYRYVSGENTLYKNIHSLLPGHSFTLSKKNNFAVKQKRWWNLSEKINNHSPIVNPIEWFQETFASSIRYRMISDVPVGILLSGGLDSTSVAATVKKTGFENINTFNIGFPGFKDDESVLAKQFSDKVGFPFHSIAINGDEFYNLLERSSYIHDEPLIHQNDPQLVGISSYAKKHVTVLLSGEGSDELMAGYVRYKPLQYSNYDFIAKPLLNLIPKKYKNTRLTKLESYLKLDKNTERQLFNSTSYFPSDYNKYGISEFEIENSYRYDVLKEAQALYPKNALRQALYYDQHTYLCSLNNRNDRATMAASIECREPFLDYRLIEGIGSLPNNYFIKNGLGKTLLRDSLGSELGESIVNNRKIGLSIPWKELVNSSLQLKHEWEHFHLSPVLKHGILAKLDIAAIKKDYNNGDSSKESILRHLFMLVFWHKQNFN